MFSSHQFSLCFSRGVGFSYTLSFCLTFLSIFEETIKQRFI